MPETCPIFHLNEMLNSNLFSIVVTLPTSIRNLSISMTATISIGVLNIFAWHKKRQNMTAFSENNLKFNQQNNLTRSIFLSAILTDIV